MKKFLMLVLLSSSLIAEDTIFKDVDLDKIAKESSVKTNEELEIDIYNSGVEEIRQELNQKVYEQIYNIYFGDLVKVLNVVYTVSMTSKYTVKLAPIEYGEPLFFNSLYDLKCFLDKHNYKIYRVIENE